MPKPSSSPPKLKFLAIAAFAAFLLGSLALAYQPGIDIGRDFLTYLWRMIRVLPCVFILIGLFDVWVKTETIERHLGEDSGPAAHLWAILLSGTALGGMHVALPIAHALYQKRAKLSVVMTFVSCGSICRIPMVAFEASYLGWRFTLIRMLVSLPIAVSASIALGNWFAGKGYRLPDAEQVPPAFAPRTGQRAAKTEVP